MVTTASPSLHALIVGLWAGVLLFAGCSVEEGTNATSPEPAPAQRYAAATEHTGTAKMAAVLKAIRAEALRHPMDYYHLNRQRAQVLGRQLQNTESPARALRLQHARELLFAGSTSEAIRALGRLLEGDSVHAYRATPTTKAVLDLLAAAYLQRSMQAHCVKDRSAASCILPIRAAAVHANPAGPRAAIVLYEKILRQLPTDYQSRWLLNVASMMIGVYPEGIPTAWRIPDLSGRPEASVRPFRDVAPTLGVDHKGLSGGVSLEDFNNDGVLDLLTTSYGLDDPMKFYLADGTGGFVDRTKAAGLNGLVGGLNTIHADYNNDGYDDVFVLRGAWLGPAGRHPNSLLRNNGDNTFTDVTYRAGLATYHPTQTAAWADFDRDGWVDLFVGNESDAQVGRVTGASSTASSTHSSALYHNNGDGTFTNVATAMGLNLTAYVKGTAWGDVNQDGWPDLYVSVLGGPNRLYVNQGGASMANRRFVERAEQAGVQAPRYSFPVWFWDYNNDGRDDLFVAGYDTRYLDQLGRAMAVEQLQRNGTALFQQTTRPRVYRNDGDGTFTEVAEALNLDKMLFAMGANYGDLDNDGYQDVYVGTGAPSPTAIVPNRMFHNRAGERFDEVSYQSGTAHLQKGHAVAFGDVDNDGDQDLYSVIGGAVNGDAARNVLFENPGHGHAWITLDLEGRSANRSAIGTRIRLVATTPRGNRRVIYRTVSTGGSFGASSLQQEIGLGTATRIDTLRITWPTRLRSVDTYTDLAVNQHLKIVEGHDHPRKMNRPTVSLSGSTNAGAR